MSKSTSQRSAAAIVNNSAQPTSPRSPLHGSASVFDRRGARAKSSKLAPLLVLAGFRTHKQLTKNKSHQVTPFWHNDTRPRVTVTFGARRGISQTQCHNFRIFRPDLAAVKIDFAWKHPIL